MTFRFKVKGDPKVDAVYPWLAVLEHYSILSCIMLVAVGFILVQFFDVLVLWSVGGMLTGLGMGVLFMAGLLRTLLTKQVVHD